jgi:signal transduction histidine kinase
MRGLADGLIARLTRVGGWRQINGPLFRKYVTLFLAVVCVVLISNGLFEIAFYYQDHRSSLIRIHREQAAAAADKITQFIKEIEGQIGWATQLPWSQTTLDQRRVDGLRLLRQVPAITELSQLDPAGREQLRISRLLMDVAKAETDFSNDPKFAEAVAKKTYFGPVYFRRESEPYMILSMTGTGRDSGVSVAEVNLKFIWDVVSQIKVGTDGHAYVVDAEGRLIAHPDISLVLRNTDMARLAHVAAARDSDASAVVEPAQVAYDINGREVLTTHASVAPLGWLVFVELPTDEAYAPLRQALLRSGALLAAGLILALLSAVFLASRIAVPIQAMRAGAARIGGGDLSQRLSVKTGDELEALADQFNRMAEQLEDSYASLERKVNERTHQLALANLAKSRFLAAASHDLRQPLQALGLLVAQLRSKPKAAERNRLIDRIDIAVAAMNDLFDALLDISKLDAGVLTTTITTFPVAKLLRRVESTFAEMARQKALSFRVVSSGTFVRSDPILLERVILNLVSNAVRYTASGGVVLGCRRRGDVLRIEVWDTGPGIPADQRQNIFSEFYRLGDPRGGGFGLGLAIVDRLGRLLGHPIELASAIGRGSRFSVAVPAAPPLPMFAEPENTPPIAVDLAAGKRVVVIDDDALVRDSLAALLRTWGCQVVAAATPREVVERLANAEPPDLIICDFQLAGGRSGIAAIAEVRQALEATIPAFLISGDTAPERLRDAQQSGYRLLHKPVRPMKLRALLGEYLRSHGAVGAIL